MLATLERLPGIFGRQAEALHLNGEIFATITWPALSTTVWRKIMKNFTMRIVPVLLATAASAHCGGDSNAPTGVPVGNYTAIQFVTTGSSGQRDELAAGSTLTLNLAANGTTSGHLHVAASASNPVLDADMAGTWREDGNVVTVSQEADTFVKEMPFTLSNDPVNGWILVGDKSFNSVRIQLTLRPTAICPAC